MQGGGRNRLYVLCVLILGGVLLSSCSATGGTTAAGQPPGVSNSTESIEPTPSIPCENVSVANPASTYCAMLGYRTGTQETAEGQVGTCVMPDDTVCDAWQFLRGTCGQEFSWCAQNGYQIQNVIETDGSSTQEYAVCVDASGNTVGTVFGLSGLQGLLESCSRR